MTPRLFGPGAHGLNPLFAPKRPNMPSSSMGRPSATPHSPVLVYLRVFLGVISEHAFESNYVLGTAA